MKRTRSGLTIVEMLVVVGIIAILVGLLLPAISMVRRTAAEAKQKVQLAAIDVALVAFRDDYGDYPPSDNYSRLEDTTSVDNTSGAQKLAEAMLGYDLLGFHPDSGWRADGYNRWSYRDSDGTTYDAGNYFLYDSTIDDELDKRKDRYLDIDTANPVQVGVTTTPRDGLFDLGSLALAPETYVLSDVFGRGEDVYVTDATGISRKIEAGLPVLYYRANASFKARGDVYDYEDNWQIVDAANYTLPGGGNASPIVTNTEFYRYITDWRSSTSTLNIPYKPDSYLLITAGYDGRYGTEDDICNFKR